MEKVSQIRASLRTQAINRGALKFIFTIADNLISMHHHTLAIEKHNNIRSDLMRIIYSSVPISLMTVLINSIILSVIQWNVITHSTILIWFASANSLSLFRLYFYFQFNQLSTKQPVPVFFERIILLSSIASGAVWGSVAIWLIPVDNIPYQIFPAFVLAGMCAGAVTTLSAIMSSIVSFIVFTMLPLIYCFLSIDTDMAYAMSFMTILFTLMMLMTAKRLNSTMRESLLIRKENSRVEEKIRSSEKRFRDLTDLLPEAIYETDAELKITYANQCALDMFGLSEDDINSGFYSIDLFVPEDRALIQRNINKRMQDKSLGLAEYKAVTKDGAVFPVMFNASCITKDNEVTGIRGVIVNITERKESEQALRRSQKMEALGQLTGGIAHDFNNILNIILGNLELLEKQSPDESSVKKRLQNINKSARRAVDLTRQLLSFSRHQAQGVATININQLIEEMGTLITQSITPQVEIEWHLAQDLWTTEIATGDFEDSLLNLVLNARDAMSGSGNLTIETLNSHLDKAYCIHHPDVKPGDYVQLKVCDRGEGMTAEQLDHIFEPFYTTKEQGKGTGLGLAMVFGFMQRSGGYINVDSVPAAGTTFRLYLPRSNAALPLAHVAIKSAEEKVPTGNETILVVDDEAALRELTSEILTSLGYCVFTAEDGQQALDILAGKHHIDMLISDVIMPGGLNGYQLAERATADYPELKVILASGYTEKITTNKNHERFSEDLLAKPYRLDDLAIKVRTMFNR